MADVRLAENDRPRLLDLGTLLVRHHDEVLTSREANTANRDLLAIPKQALAIELLLRANVLVATDLVQIRDHVGVVVDIDRRRGIPPSDRTGREADRLHSRIAEQRLAIRVRERAESGDDRVALLPELLDLPSLRLLERENLRLELRLDPVELTLELADLGDCEGCLGAILGNSHRVLSNPRLRSHLYLLVPLVAGRCGELICEL